MHLLGLQQQVLRGEHRREGGEGVGEGGDACREWGAPHHMTTAR